MRLAGRIDAVLPQTQCTRCGYPDCRSYAEAMASGEARINRCPPGGDEGVRELAALLGVSPLPLDPACGHPGPRTVASIDEAHCIGCTLCIQACPVDAIAGAAKLMHTVIAAQCTGCELCLPPCPVDCIEMVAPRGEWSAVLKRAAGERGRKRLRRLRTPVLHRSQPEERKRLLAEILARKRR